MMIQGLAMALTGRASDAIANVALRDAAHRGQREQRCFSRLFAVFGARSCGDMGNSKTLGAASAKR